MTTRTADFAGVERESASGKLTGGHLPPGRLGRWLFVFCACAAFAHGCHSGDHGDADLLVRVFTAVGSPPAAASP